MAQLINASNVIVEVSAFEPNAGDWTRTYVRPGRKTREDVDVAAVRGHDGLVFDQQGWVAVPSVHRDWNTPRPQEEPESTMPASGEGCVVFLHNASPPREESIIELWSDANLHVVYPANDAVEPYEHAVACPYRRTEDQFVDGVVADPPIELTEASGVAPGSQNEYGTSDGEYSRGDLPLGLTLFGSFIQTGPSITVRLAMKSTLFHFAENATELKELLERRLPEWKQEIRSEWNNADVPPPNVPDPETGQLVAKSKLRLDVEWVPSWVPEHFNVWISPDEHLRSFMFLWSIGLDSQAGAEASSHEYGHYLGLADSYIYAQEWAGLHEQIEASGFEPPQYGWWDRWFNEFGPTLLTEYKNRVERRINGGQCAFEAHHMEKESEVVTQLLVDCVAARTEQPLCYHPRLWPHLRPRT